MKTEHQIIINGLQDEALRILRFYLSYKRILERIPIIASSSSREELADILIALKCIENDLIIRTVKLDDKRKDTTSFKNAIKKYKMIEPDQLKIDNALNLHTKYGKLALKFKKRRDEKLGHLKKGSFDDYDLKYDFLPLITVAIDLIDLISMNTMNYLWKDNNLYEDLREKIFKKS